MRKVIKSDLYYFFHNRIFFIFVILMAIYISVKGWLHNDYISYNEMPSALYLMTYDTITAFVINVVLLGIAMNDFFKNGMMENQYIYYRNGMVPLFGLSISGMIFSVILLIPTAIIFGGLTIINGSQCDNIYIFKNANAQPLLYLVLLIVMVFICLCGFSAEMVTLSYICKSEKKGITIACVFELLLVILSMANFYGNYIKIPKNLENVLLSFSVLFNLLTVNNAPIEYSKYNSETGINNISILGLPLLCMIIKLFVLYMIVRKNRK